MEFDPSAQMARAGGIKATANAHTAIFMAVFISLHGGMSLGLRDSKAALLSPKIILIA
jgi:hypothetical protein